MKKLSTVILFLFLAACSNSEPAAFVDKLESVGFKLTALEKRENADFYGTKAERSTSYEYGEKGHFVVYDFASIEQRDEAVKSFKKMQLLMSSIPPKMYVSDTHIVAFFSHPNINAEEDINPTHMGKIAKAIQGEEITVDDIFVNG